MKRSKSIRRVKIWKSKIRMSNKQSTYIFLEANTPFTLSTNLSLNFLNAVLQIGLLLYLSENDDHPMMMEYGKGTGTAL